MRLFAGCSSELRTKMEKRKKLHSLSFGELSDSGGW